ncbi:hypothetical protein BS329_20690 [Amycolatopsis coloradensis]|uniref:Uncharacterized protein n=1 Tax=Amycolatopsis coloradensis TaxID=76021 RepID=A0A1R0KQY4_9PSEU|nr:hypothetical protein BS329_20690 [Amycolatopsis coloradensis]
MLAGGDQLDRVDLGAFGSDAELVEDSLRRRSRSEKTAMTQPPSRGRGLILRWAVGQPSWQPSLRLRVIAG